jgi:SAM-dependent methyltransferase
MQRKTEPLEGWHSSDTDEIAEFLHRLHNPPKDEKATPEEMERREEVTEAAARAERAFPFPHFFEQRRLTCERTAMTALRWVPSGGTVLDFGAGAADKTAVLDELGYRCIAVDDLKDEWHQRNGHRDLILRFAEGRGIDYRLELGELPPLDAVLMDHVLEHIHHSPRALLLKLIEALRLGGHLIIVVPNAANIRKRLAVLRGKSNYQRFELYFWLPVWRHQHVREYVREDLEKLGGLLGLETLELRGVHTHLAYARIRSGPVMTAYRLATRVFPWWRDSLLLVAEKPENWRPPEQDLDELYEEILPSGLSET